LMALRNMTWRGLGWSSIMLLSRRLATTRDSIGFAVSVHDGRLLVSNPQQPFQCDVA
jgi:hypothetical protein